MSITFHTAKLREIAELNPRLNESLESNALVSFVPMSAVTAETASTTSGEERQYSEVSKGYTPFRDGDVLMAKITPCFENGKIAQATISHRIGFGSTEFHVVRPINGKSDARYLLHFLRQERVRRDGERKMTGSAGQRRVPEHFLASIEIPLPPLAEQRRIANILDRTEALRAKRRATLTQLDTLTASIFLDMFGDPATNPKKWPKSPFENITSRTRTGLKRGPFGGALKKEIFVEAGYKVYEQQHAIYKDHESGKYFITERKYREMEAFAIEPGDFIVSCSGTVGRIYRLPPCAPKGVINQALLRITLDEERIEPTFFEALFESDEFQRSLLGSARGTGINNFPPMERIRAISIILPPLELQRSFSRCIAALEKLKVIHHSSLAELNALFASLLHRAFREELQVIF